MQLCDELPEEMRVARSLSIFKSPLQTHFYRCALIIDFLLIFKTQLLNKMLL